MEEGLAAGDRVIVEGLQKIAPGMPAKVAEPPPAKAPATRIHFIVVDKITRERKAQKTDAPAVSE